ncbi:hypothetical protein ACKP2L_07150 [Oenococcus alcoholitolerans]|uniref:SEFIR domain-containing protein n=1 Tax=Oenococcus alcoholitolerans TaxID=931074 RepID=A0ABR4XSQ2_9LACO|nr:hypothetical protein Q757_01100 [Oenococcus alcoholitolerans]
MEKSLTRPDVDYIIVLCDQDYKDKADKKDGSGASTESTIMTPKVYDSVENTCIIPLAVDFNAEGKAIVSTFLATKKYIKFQCRGGFMKILRFCGGSEAPFSYIGNVSERYYVIRRGV